MCLVEMEKSPKPIASCAMPVGRRHGHQDQHADGPEGAQGRDGVPADQPSARLPDLRPGRRVRPAGPGDGLRVRPARFKENKRAVRDKDLGPLVKTDMNRCIHCTRCIRFLDEIAGVEELGAHRPRRAHGDRHLCRAGAELRALGQHHRPLPGRRADLQALCVRARPWELRKTESIDVLDAVGSNIRVDARGREVLRVLPRLNEDVNEEWISRQDPLRLRRAEAAPARRADGPARRQLQPADWREAFAAIAERLDGVAGDQDRGDRRRSGRLRGRWSRSRI